MQGLLQIRRDIQTWGCEFHAGSSLGNKDFRKLSLNSSLPKSRQQNLVYKFSKNVTSKLYHIEIPKTRGQTL